MSAEEQTPFVAATETDLLHRLVEVNPGYLWATDRDLRYTALFGRRVHSKGWTPAEIYGRHLSEFAGGVPANVVEAHERALAGESVSYEFEINGRFWRSRVEPLEGADGTIIGVAGASLDVTELIHTSQELAENRAKLDLALTQLPAIFWATDEKLCMTSAAGRPIRGRAIESWIGKPLRELLGSDDHPAVLAHEKALRGGSGAYELMIDGREYEIRVEPLRCDTGEIIGAVGIAIDGTDRTAHRRTVEELARLVHHSSDAISGIGRDGLVYCWNPAAERLFGWTADEMIGQPTDRIIPPEDRREWEELRGRVWAGETIEQLATTRIRKDGTRIRVWLIRSPIYDDRGEVVGFSAIVRDLTPLERAEERRQTSQKLEAVARLAGGIAQDFNNLLTAISGYSELAARDVPEGPARAALQAIQSATERGVTLTQGLLAFSQRQLLHPRPVDMNRLLADVLPLVERLTGREVTVALDLAPDAPPVQADPDALRQILFDLALNARDAMPQGGTLTIATRKEADAGLLRVIDTGVGMDTATRERAFDPFFSTKDDVGSGLGLAAVHGTVLQSGGQLRLDSSPGGGTTIELRLPLAGEERPLAPAPVSTARILLVEDDELVRRLVVQTLEGSGYTVTAATGVSEALDLVRRDVPFDLLLTDLVMPELYGDELVAQVRELRPGLPAIVMSGYVSDPDAFPLSVEFLSKPFRPADLVAAVARTLAQP